MVIRPKVHQSARELAAVVYEDSNRCSTLSDNLIAGFNNILAAETLSDSDAQRFAREDIDHGQRTELSPVGELVGDKIHRPRLVNTLRHIPLSSSDGHFAPARPLTAQLQAFLRVEPIREFST